jgi:hypothetical protein
MPPESATDDGRDLHGYSELGVSIQYRGRERMAREPTFMVWKLVNDAPVMRTALPRVCL